MKRRRLFTSKGLHWRRIAGRFGVVPNRYPAVASGGIVPDAGKQGEFFPRRDGTGVHEVIIEAPEHEAGLSTFATAHLELVLRVYQKRLQALRRLDGISYGLVFRNHGPDAGASLPHPHAQVVGTPVVPPAIERIRHREDAYLGRWGRCLSCDILQQEIREGDRIVLKNSEFAAFAPYASRVPFEMMVVPRNHASHFDELSPAALPALATLLQDLVRRLERHLHSPQYNLIVQTGSPTEPESAARHWHIELLPRLTRSAGLEWGSGLRINTFSPEAAAKLLRS